jgi:hypothetical protein
MKQRVAATTLVTALIRSRIAIHDGKRAQRTAQQTACRLLAPLCRRGGGIPGGEILALLAISHVHDRAAGHR